MPELQNVEAPEAQSQQKQTLYDQLLQSNDLEVSGGLPVKDAEELGTCMVDLLMNRKISRMPIIGMNDGKIFVQARQEHNDHQTLLHTLVGAYGYAGEQNVKFTTSLETFQFDKPDGSYLELTVQGRPLYVKVGKGSDTITAGLESVEQIQSLFAHVAGAKLIQ